MGYLTSMEGEEEAGSWSQEDEKRESLTVMRSGGGGKGAGDGHGVWRRGKKGKSHGSHGLTEGKEEKV